MKQVNQTICNFDQGNCMQACVASIFELPLDKVPNFMFKGPDSYYKKLDDWCEKSGLICLDVNIKHLSVIKDCYVIVYGESPRDRNYNHAVIYYNGKMIHDPNPDKKGIVGKPECLSVFIIKDPSNYSKIIKGEKACNYKTFI